MHNYSDCVFGSECCQNAGNLNSIVCLNPSCVDTWRTEVAAAALLMYCSRYTSHVDSVCLNSRNTCLYTGVQFYSQSKSIFIICHHGHKACSGFYSAKFLLCEIGLFSFHLNGYFCYQIANGVCKHLLFQHLITDNPNRSLMNAVCVCASGWVGI